MTQRSASLDEFEYGRNAYSILFWFMIKDEAVSRISNSDLSEKKDDCKKKTTTKKWDISIEKYGNI